MKKTLIKLLLSGITTIFANGCVENYHGEFVMAPAGRAWVKTGEAYSDSGTSFSELKVGKGFVKGGEGLLRTVCSTVTTVNNTADLALGGVTTPVSYIGGPARWPDDFRKTTLDSFVGGEDFNDSWSFEYWHSPCTQSFASAEDHHGPGAAATIDGIYKTLIRFAPIAAVAAGGGGGGGGGGGSVGGAGPGPTPPDPF